MEKIAYIAIAGAAGTLTRYGVVSLFQRDGVSGMPWGVFAANMVGSLLFGLIWAMSGERPGYSAGWIHGGVYDVFDVGFR